MKSHNELTFEAAKSILSGMSAGSYFSVALVSAMQRGERVTLGQILVNEAWDMASCLVERYEMENNNNESSI